MPSPLFANAIASIEVGVADYQANEPERALSAIRNFMAGVLLLAKEALVRRAPEADPAAVIAKSFEPVPDGNGGIVFKASTATIDFENIKRRFKSFGLAVDDVALIRLNHIRNDVEHRHTDHSPDELRRAIATGFPVVSAILRQMGENPAKALPKAWPVMIAVHDTHVREVEACKLTFILVKWPHPLLADVNFVCPACGWDIVAQKVSDNTSHENIECTCRKCGHEFPADEAIEKALDEHFAGASYIAMTDGGDPPVSTCPECAVEAYVISDGVAQCMWCGESLDECVVCHTSLTPDNVDCDNSDICASCGNAAARD